jgi:hypothetical protein
MDLEIAIVDILGRRIATLANGSTPSGPIRIMWDGDLPGGKPAAAGLYLLMVQSGSTLQTTKIVKAN